MPNAIRAESPNHLTNAPFTSDTNEAQGMNRADGAHGLCRSMPGPLAQADMKRAVGHSFLVRLWSCAN